MSNWLTGLFYNNYNKRVEYIDVARGVSILIIVYAHIYSNNSTITDYVHLFHVPIFFFISGMLWKKKEVSYNFKRIFVSLVIPYVLISSFSIFVYEFLGSYVNGESGLLTVKECIAGLVYANSRTGLMKWNRPLWFIPCLATVKILWDLIKKINSQLLQCALAMVLWLTGIILCNTSLNSLRLPWELEVALNMLPYYVVGTVYSKFNIYQKDFYKNRAIFFFALLATVLITCIIFEYNIAEISVQYNVYGNYLLFVVGAFAGIFMILLLAQSMKKIKILQIVGQNSMLILLWHKFPVMIFQITKFGKECCQNANSVLSVIIGAIVVAISATISLIIGSIFKWIVLWIEDQVHNILVRLYQKK